MTMNRFFFSCLVCLLFSNGLLAQNEANIWYFGFNAGIDFNSGIAVPISNGQVNSNEGGSSICSPSGNLLFYSDGVSVWDQTHAVMPNGSGLLGGMSSTTSALIVPRPNSCKRYFLFTVEDHQGVGNSFRYSEVDLTLNGGLGDVIPGVKNILLSQPCGEKITAIRHANGIDYWIITHALLTNDYLAYLVTAAGVNPVPVTSSVGVVHASNCMIGFMKANHAGTKIVSAQSFCNSTQIVDFDAATGLVTNPITINVPGNRVYGIEFSPNDAILYLCTFWVTSELYQVDPLAPATQFLVTSVPGNYIFGGLQLGPDGIIYQARTNQNFLSTISNPNVWGIGCGYTANGFTLSPGRTSGTGIVSYPPSYLTAVNPNPSDFSFQLGCIGDSSGFFANVGVPFDSITWNFGDPGSGFLNFANGDTVYHVYNSAGTYAVQMIVHGCFPDTIVHSINIAASQNLNLGPDTSYCSAISVVLDAGPGWSSVLWSPSGSNTQTITVQNSGTYGVQVSNTCGTYTDSITIQFGSLPPLFLGNDTAICNGQNLSLAANAGNYTYLWNNGSTSSSLTTSQAGTYSVTVTDTLGCASIDSMQLTVSNGPQLQFQTTNVSCNGLTNGSVSGTATGFGPFQWQWLAPLNQSTPTVSGLGAGTYSYQVGDSIGCLTTGSVTITQPNPLAGTFNSSSLPCNNASANGTANAIVSGGQQPYSYVWNTVPVQTTALATGLSAGNYAVTVTDAGGCQIVLSGSLGQNTAPIVTAGPDQSFCEGEGGVVLSAVGSGGTPGYYYTWWCATPPCGLDSVNDNDPNANPTMSQWYYVQVTDTNGCLSNIDSVFVTILPKPIVDAGRDIIICGDSAPCQVLSPSISNAAGPYAYQWLPSAGLNNPNILNPCARPDTTTIYALLVTAGNGCTSNFTTTDTLSTVTVFVNPVPVAEAGLDRDICLGDSVVLQGFGTNAGPLYAFEWTPATGLSASNIPNPRASPWLTTAYTLVVWSNGCPSYGDSVRIKVHTLPTVDAGWDREICPGTETLLDGTAGGDSTATYSFQWWPSNGVNGSAQVEDLIAGPLQTTTYYLQAMSNYGCLSPVDSATVHVIPAPFAEAGPNMLICPGDTTLLDASYWFSTPDSAPQSQIYFSWTPATQINDSTLLQPLVWPGQSMWYYLDVRYNLCHSQDSVLVTIGGAAMAQINPDTNVICQQDSILLNAAGSLGSTFSWTPTTGLSDPTSLSPMASPDSSTVYWLHIGEGGCLDSMMFALAVLPKPDAAYLSSAPGGCVPHSVNFLENSAGGTAFVWNFGDGSPVSNVQTPVHTYANVGTYNVSLTVVAEGGCSDEVNNLQIIVGDTATAEFSSNPPFPVEMSLPNTAVTFSDRSTNASHWRWDFGDGIVSTEINPVHAFTAPGTYFVTLSVNNAEGCVSEIVHGPYIVTLPDLFIPNVFSPNGDGVNDEFMVQYTGSQPYLVQIFDRWGVLLSENRTKTKGWKGNNLKGEAVVDGIYYYLVKIGDREFNGHVTLVR